MPCSSAGSGLRISAFGTYNGEGYRCYLCLRTPVTHVSGLYTGEEGDATERVPIQSAQAEACGYVKN